MYKIVSSILMLGVSLSVFSQKKVSSKLTDVTVYQYSALVKRTATVNLTKGSQSFVIEGVSPHMIPNSLQIYTSASVELGSINVVQDFLTKPELLDEVEDLKEQVKDLNLKYEMRKRTKEAYQSEKELILANKKILGEGSLTIEDLVELADIYRVRLREIEAKLLEIGEEEKILADDLKRLRSQLQSSGGTPSTYYKRVEVSLSSTSATTATIEFSYQVNQAGWSPLYDIRCEEFGEPIALAYKANVFQRTGVNWEGVTLSLSTGNPLENGNIPTLNTHYVDITKPSPNNYNVRGARAKAESDDEPTALYMDGVAMTNSTVTEGLMNTYFEINGKIDLPANGKNQTVGISNHKLPAQYEYYVASNKARFAFLTAKVTGWESLQLLPGNSRIYYQNKLTGNAYVNPNQTESELVFSLGQDKGIVVERKRKVDLDKNSKLAGSNKKWYGFEIAVRNTKSKLVKLKIQDQVPVSRNTDLSVEIENLSGGSLNNETGVVTWMKDIQPSATSKIDLTYQVKFPKGYELIGH